MGCWCLPPGTAEATSGPLWTEEGILSAPFAVVPLRRKALLDACVSVQLTLPISLSLRDGEQGVHLQPKFNAGSLSSSPLKRGGVTV